MSEPKASGPLEEGDAQFQPAEELQFEQAEYAAPAAAHAGPSCGLCKLPIADAYYEAGGKILCTTCRQRVEAAFRGGPRVGRGLKAIVLGTIAAIAGAVLYYAITRATGYNLGIVAVVVGLMVGGAVRAGSGNRGGAFYQAVALFLTYSAIVAMYVPLVFGGWSNERQKKEPAADAIAGKGDRDRLKGASEPNRPGVAANKSAPAKADAAAEKVAARDVLTQREKITQKEDNALAPGGAPSRELPSPNLLGILIFLVFMIGLLYAIPVTVAIHAPISGLIFGFALWEAWKINKRTRLVFNGPFRVGTEGSGAHAAGV